MAIEDTNDVQGGDRRQQILDAALKVFSHKGFHKATNKDVAEAAGGISPGLIYWYFTNKEDLLLSVVRERATLLQLVERADEMMLLTPEQFFRQIASAYVSAISNNGALFRIMFSEVSRFPQLGEMLYRLLIGKLFGLIDRYLQAKIASGELRPIDTATAARNFMGMLVIQGLAREVFHQPEAIATSNALLVDTIVDMTLHGLTK